MKDGEFYFVDAMHEGNPLRTKPAELAYNLLGPKDNNIFSRIGEICRILKESGGSSILDERLGTELAGKLLAQLNQKDYKPKVILDISLTFPSNHSIDQMRSFMTGLAKNPGIQKKADLAKIEPIIVVRQFTKEATAGTEIVRSTDAEMQAKSIDELLDPKTQEIRLGVFEKGFNAAVEATQAELGLTKDQLEILISGGTRYLANGLRKDIDIVVNLKSTAISAEKVRDLFLIHFDRQMKLFVGQSGQYNRQRYAKNVWSLTLPSADPAAKEFRKVRIEFFLPELRNGILGWTNEFLDFVPSPEECLLLEIIKTTRSYVYEGPSQSSTYLRYRVRNYLRAEYFLGNGSDSNLWRQIRQLFVSAGPWDQEVMRSILRNSTVESHERGFLTTLDDPIKKAEALKRIAQRLREPLSDMQMGVEAVKGSKKNGQDLGKVAAFLGRALDQRESYVDQIMAQGDSFEERAASLREFLTKLNSSFDFKSPSNPSFNLPPLKFISQALDDKSKFMSNIKKAEQRRIFIRILDYYFFYHLSSLALRCFREEHSLDELQWLLDKLQLVGHEQFVSHVEDLWSFATSEFSYGGSYARLMQMAQKQMSKDQLRRMALMAVPSTASHLRFIHLSREIRQYQRDITVRRSINYVDYFWLIFNLNTLFEWYDELRAGQGNEAEKTRVMEAIVVGFSADNILGAFSEDAFGFFRSDIKREMADNKKEEQWNIWDAIIPDQIHRFVQARNRHWPELSRSAQQIISTPEVHSPIYIDIMFMNMFFRSKLVASMQTEQYRDLTINDVLTSAQEGKGRAKADQVRGIVKISNENIVLLRKDFPLPGNGKYGNWYSFMTYDDDPRRISEGALFLFLADKMLGAHQSEDKKDRKIAAKVLPYGAKPFDLLTIMRGLDFEDSYSHNQVLDNIRKAEARARAEGRKPRILVIGAGAGRIIYDIKGFTDADLDFINKEQIVLDSDPQRAAQMFERAIDHDPYESRTPTGNEAREFLDSFQKNVILRDLSTSTVVGSPVADAGEPLFQDGKKYDFILVTSGTMGYIKNKIGLLKRIKKALVKDGTAIVNALYGMYKDMPGVDGDPVFLFDKFKSVGIRSRSAYYVAIDNIDPQADPFSLRLTKQKEEDNTEHDAIVYEETYADQQMDAKSGGIDLTSDKALQVKNEGDGIKFHLDDAMLARLQNSQGFYPEIIEMKPLEDVPAFLGLPDIGNSTV